MLLKDVDVSVAWDEEQPQLLTQRHQDALAVQMSSALPGFAAAQREHSWPDRALQLSSGCASVDSAVNTATVGISPQLLYIHTPCLPSLEGVSLHTRNVLHALPINGKL